MNPKPLLVLVADDDVDVCGLLRLWLLEVGHTVTAVANATEATALLKENQFDLVVTDMLMPKGDGLDLIAHVRQSLPRAGILAISGGGRFLESDNCLKTAQGFGAHAVLKKPFSRRQLFEAVAEALAPQSRFVSEQ